MPREICNGIKAPQNIFQEYKVKKHIATFLFEASQIDLPTFGLATYKDYRIKRIYNIKIVLEYSCKN